MTESCLAEYRLSELCPIECRLAENYLDEYHLTESKMVEIHSAESYFAEILSAEFHLAEFYLAFTLNSHNIPMWAQEQNCDTILMGSSYDSDSILIRLKWDFDPILRVGDLSRIQFNAILLQFRFWLKFDAILIGFFCVTLMNVTWLWYASDFGANAI